MKITNDFIRKYRFPLLILLSLLIAMATWGHADEFEDMMKSEMEGYSQEEDFQQYRDQINSEFEIYKKIVDKEYKKFRDEILKFWDKPEMTDKKKFVEYSPDMKTKKIVDFEKGQIEINIITPVGKKEDDIKEEINKKLKDLIKEDTNEAFKRDKFTTNVENQIVKAAKNVKTSVVKNVPIITEVVTGTTKPSDKQVEKAAEKLQKQAVIKKQPSLKVPGSEVVTIKIKLPSDSMKKKAMTYIDPVKKYSKKRGIDPSLVLAVMQTESAFNPMARSYVPAYGLMQIVPKSAGIDASEIVYGEKQVLSPSFLYNGDNNIKIGAAYLYILNYRYLKKIENDESRLYCVIAAYNTGAGNVARTFTGKTNISKAAKKINQMTPDEVYQKLRKNLPHDETRHYVKKVTERIKLYR